MRVPHPRFVSPILTALLLAGAVLPLAAAPVAATGGDAMVSVVNRYRSEAGLGAVALHGTIDALAQERSDQVAAAQQLGHDFEALKVRFAQLGICWSAFGEIVLRNSRLDYEAFILQWYNSPTHNAQMLGSAYTHAGGSWTQGTDGRYYAVMIFVQLCGESPPPWQPSVTFYDTVGSPFLADIEWLAAAGISNGCGGGAFCPGSVVTREQMASFLTRALGLPAAGTDYFWDDAGSMHEDAINRLAAAGITTGCAAGQYCPSAGVTREQMAAFLHRAFD